MTTTSFFLAFILGVWALARMIRQVGRQHVGLAIGCLLAPPLLMLATRHYHLDFSREYRILGVAAACLLPSAFYFFILGNL